MGKAGKISIGHLIIKVALAVIFIITGLALLGDNGFFATSQIRSAINKLFGSDLRKIACIVMGVVLLLCGIFIGLKVFALNFGKIDNVIYIVTLIAWIAVIVLVDIIPGLDIDNSVWWGNCGKDLLIIGSLLTVSE